MANSTIHYVLEQYKVMRIIYKFASRNGLSGALYRAKIQK